MGKNLKGKECGKGICQRKDGLYCARFVCYKSVKKTRNRYFQYYCQKREIGLKKQNMRIQHESRSFVPTDTIVDEWFDFWIENIVGDFGT